MKPIAKALALSFALTTALNATVAAGANEDYADYYAARQALDRNDCDAAIEHLQAFLDKHVDVKEKYPDFYLDIRIVMGQCSGAIKVRGVEGESDEIDPLPDHPPMVE